MKFKALILVAILITNSSLAQKNRALYFSAKEFNKDIALYHAKSFVMDILEISNNVTKFQIDPLAASNSGEIISLVYKCEEKKKEGLVLGFYGNRWNENGVTYNAYSFKNIPKDKADEMLEKIESAVDKFQKYIDADPDNNNIYFQYDDIVFLIYRDTNAYGGRTRIRLFWNDYDSEWEYSTFRKTRKRLNKKLD